MTAKPTALAYLSAAPMFAVLDRDSLAGIADRMRPVSYTAGQSIFSRGDPGREVFLVMSGRVRLSILTPEGRELALAHASAGQIFGEIATLDGKARTADATAITAVSAMVLPQAALVGLIETNPAVAKSIIAFLCDRFRETDDKLAAIALQPIEVRLSRFLLSALRLQCPGQKGERVRLDLGMSQSELAMLIAASRPKVNAALTTLEDQGAIERDGAILVCNTELLADIAGQD